MGGITRRERGKEEVRVVSANRNLRCSRVLNQLGNGGESLFLVLVVLFLVVGRRRIRCDVRYLKTVFNIRIGEGSNGYFFAYNWEKGLLQSIVMLKGLERFHKIFNFLSFPPEIVWK